LPTRCQFLEQHPLPWQTIRFGPGYGVAVDTAGALFFWGTAEEEEEAPMPIRHERGARARQESLAAPPADAPTGPMMTKMARMKGDADHKPTDDEELTEDYVQPVQNPAAKAAPTAVIAAGEDKAALPVTGHVLTGEDILKAMMKRQMGAEPVAVKPVEPTRLFGKDSFVSVGCTEEYLYAARKDGAVYRCEVKELLNGKEDYQIVKGLPKPTMLSGERTSQISAGRRHVAFLTSSGRLFCMGANECGQCGKMPEQGLRVREEVQPESLEEPNLVKFNPGEGAATVKVVDAQCGDSHTVVLDRNGRTWTFGDDRAIQLALGDTRTGGADVRKPMGTYTHKNQPVGQPLAGPVQQRNKVVYTFYDRHIQPEPMLTMPPSVFNQTSFPLPHMIAAGAKQSYFVHREGEDKNTSVIFACGENWFGQCGRSRHLQHQPLLQVRTPKETRVEKLVCGTGHCMALLDTGKIFTWGANWKGQVGTGKRAHTAPPVILEIEDEPETAKVTALFASDEASALILDGP